MINKTNYVKLILSAALFFVLLCSGNNSLAQGRDRSKFQGGYIDTSLSYLDSSLIKDSTRIRMPVDSTARVKNFKYERTDDPIPSFGDYKSPLLLYGSGRIDYTVTFDTLNNVIITESFEGEQYKVPRVIPLDKYIKIRSSLAQQDMFYRIVADSYQIETEDDLTKLFKNITEITIPLPFATETIFGPPTINLKINGTIDITASYQKSTNDLQTITSENQTQNNINFKQEVQVSTKGTVGDKLTVDADWNSQRTFEFENQLKLKYKGYPDEVIQSIEAGNVSLETRSNLIGSTQALFGVKAQFKLGPLTLTTIASQKKSEKKEVNINGGSVETNFDIPIWDYAETNYLLDETYETEFTNFYSTGITSINITKIEVWVNALPNNPNKRSVFGLDTLGVRPQNGYSITDSNMVTTAGHSLIGNFIKLNPEDFTLNAKAGYITLNGNLQASGQDALAVAYTYTDANNNSFQYGDYTTDVNSADRLKLKLLRFTSQQSPDQEPAFARLWKRMLKNIYNLGVRNITNDPSTLEFNIYYNEPGQPPNPKYNGTGNFTGRSYLNLTGLDYRINGQPSSNVPEGDDAFDFFPTSTIDLINGNIIFPFINPFSETLIQKGVESQFIGKNDTIYTSSKTTARDFGNLKFNLKGKAKGEASSRYNLGFNLVEGSVKVFNGSVELTAGVDYSIDYSLGELLIINSSALVAGANLKITYETNDLFQLASKTLLGTRAELQLSKTSYIGFTLINLKQQTLNDKIRIGEEPTNNTIIGFDASADIKTNFLTKLVNKIPGYNTKEESILSLKGEVAFMLPDPNTLKSRIPSDNGEAVAYVDDFEGVKKIIPLGLNPLSWTLSSIPVDPMLVPVFANEDARDSLMSRKRSKLQWYNLLNNVPILDVYPNRSIASNQNQTLTPFVFNIRPDEVGPYNYITQQEFLNEGTNKDKWNGVFKYLNTTQTNLVDENINYIEVWMQVNGGNPITSDSAKMIIDLGAMSEKIITTKRMPINSTVLNTNYHSEDINGSGQLDVGEDNGIDGRPNSTTGNILGEEFYFQELMQETGGDPSRDNYLWTQGSLDYAKFNGTELNATNLTEAKRIDTEDLDNDGNLGTNNSYFEYVIPLDSNSFKNHPFIAGGGNAGWYQFIIPLDQWKNKIGTNPTLTNIKYARVWFKGFQDSTTLKIVDFSLVGNQWVKSNKNDTTYTVSVVNIEDNSNIYQPPVPGDILRQKDQSQVDQNVLSNEQSISLDVNKLLPGQSKFVFKSYTTRPTDLINYKILKLFVNGDSSFTYTNPDLYDAAVIVRLGSDSSNYYEYRAPIHPDVRPGSPWNALNEVSINLAEITAVKQKRDSSGTIVYEPVNNGPPGAMYGVIGNPSIRNVTQISLGVYNNNKDPIVVKELTGSVWFDEMRVIKTNNDNGYAFTLSSGLKIADLATLNFSYNKTDPNFHSLENRFGSLTLANSWEISGQINAHKILNALLSKYVSVKFKDFFTIPISFSHSEVLDNPNYLPSTDVNLEEAAQSKYDEILRQTGNTELAEYSANQIRTSAQTLRIANRFSINGMKFTFPGDNFFVKQIINKLEVNFVRNSYTERNPTLESKYAWDMSGSVGLSSDLDLMNTLNLKIGKFLPFGDEFKDAKMYFFFPFMPLAPLFSSNIALSGNFNRRRGDEKLRTQINNSPTSRQFDATRGFNLNWKFIENWIIDITGDYSFRSGSDLTYLETTGDSSRIQRTESQIFDDIFFNGGFINWGKDLDYSQNVSINPKFNIPGLRNFLDLTSSYRVTYGWRASQYSSDLGSNVGYSSDLQATAFLKLNSIFDLFKKGPNKLIGGSSPGYQDKSDPADLIKLLGTFIPDQVNVTFSESKQLSNPGVSGRPGFGNFWMQLGSKEYLGPSRLYQLGWVSDPGSRVPFTQLTDNQNLNRTVTFNTFITPIFPNNLKINFTYKWGGGSINSLTYNTDGAGNLGSPLTRQESRTITRPSFFVSSDITNKLARPEDPTTQAKEIAESFENNIVSFPFPSWNLTLNGIEKFDLFTNIAQSVTLESGYSSEYRKILSYDGLNPEYISAQAITSGFTPLIGLNFNFKPISDGTFTASFKLSKTNSYNMEPNNAKLTNTSTNDLAINASYTKSGFNLPIFGLSLENNLTISFSYTRTKNDPIVYSYQNFLWESNTQNGSTSTTINPSIQYNLSRSVTLQLFYKYTKIEPTGSNLLITTRTSNEAGLNIRLQIQ
ncbi:MAG: cell surface protein SprA [Ignavibacteria bacterium]|nr:cell surface protein SprA [Ignavibacteria bacterium]